MCAMYVFLLNSCNVSLCVCVHACIQHTSMHRCMYVQKSPSVLILSPLAKGMEFQPFGFVFFLMTWSACLALVTYIYIPVS